MNTVVNQWLNLSVEELDDIFKSASAGKIPEGDTTGTTIFAGRPLPTLLSQISKRFAWQGKVFDIFSEDKNSGILVNKISPFSLNAIIAKVYRGNSWLDGKEAVIIDYGDTSFFAQKIRDEIREVEPGLYLGKVWWGKKRILDFALQTPAHSGVQISCPYAA